MNKKLYVISSVLSFALCMLILFWQLQYAPQYGGIKPPVLAISMFAALIISIGTLSSLITTLVIVISRKKLNVSTVICSVICAGLNISALVVGFVYTMFSLIMVSF